MFLEACFKVLSFGNEVPILLDFPLSWAACACGFVHLDENLLVSVPDLLP